MIWCQVPPFMFVSFEKLVPLPGSVLKLVSPTYRHAYKAYRRTDNTMVKRKRSNVQTTIYKTLHRKLLLLKFKYVWCIFKSYHTLYLSR